MLTHNEKGQSMKDVRSMLDEARYHIDGQVDCRTPEYQALDKLERAISLLADRVEKDSKEAARAANVASCLANGIQPD
jgi:hypothetical protein